MSHKLNIERYYKAAKERDKAKQKYDKCDEEYQDSVRDYEIYCKILDRIYSKYIKLSAANYERMIHIKNHTINEDNITITCDSIEINRNCDSIEINRNKVTFENDITINFELTDDCELLYWSYEKSDMPYNISDWAAFTMKALKLIN